MAIRYEGVARILARQDGREPEGPRQHHRDILERMHREVRPALEQRMLELLDEQRLAADLVERPILDPVAFGRHALDANLAAGVQRPQEVAHMLGLPHREPALPRGDDEAPGWIRSDGLLHG